MARPYKAREEVYKSEDPADQAEARLVKGGVKDHMERDIRSNILRKQALAMWGRTLIPAL